jgi:hypothetical protein
LDADFGDVDGWARIVSKCSGKGSRVLPCPVGLNEASEPWRSEYLATFLMGIFAQLQGTVGPSTIGIVV